MAKEYLITNGIGGYSSADMEMGNTRKYHALLVVANDNLERFNVVNRLSEEVFFDNEEAEKGMECVPLHTNIYKNHVVHPEGNQNLNSFEVNSAPEWQFTLPHGTVRKSIQVVYGYNAVVVRYEFQLQRAARFAVRPFITYRSFHAVGGVDNPEDFRQRWLDQKLEIAVADFGRLFVHAPGWEYEDKQDVYRDFLYPIEVARGYDAHEDLLTPGEFSVELPKGETVLELKFDYQGSKTTFLPEQDSFVAFEEKLANLQKVFAHKPQEGLEDLQSLLIRQADQFTIKVSELNSVIAGYHWFGDWGRDTFISFKGLYLLTGKLEDAKKLLLRWGKLFKGGFLPNRPFLNEYHSIDAVFWYFIAAWEYYQLTKDTEIRDTVIREADGVFTAFRGGSHNVQITMDGFLQDGNVGTSLTWMDAKYDGNVVTDRSGMAVEIQMLWYNLLQIALQFKREVKVDTLRAEMQSVVDLFEMNFMDKFWFEEGGYLFDVIKPEYPDGALRPNQVIGLYLPFQVVQPQRTQEILKVIEERLLTPVGLKTLSSDHPDYKPYYGGTQFERDYAYHQGTVWPFILGHYLISYLKAYDYSGAAKSYVLEKLRVLQDEIRKLDLEYIPEIYSAEDLRPDGCISQAWSAATILEVLAALRSQ